MATLTWKVKRDNSRIWTARLRQRVMTETQTFVNNVLETAKDTVRVRTGETQQSGRVEQKGVTTFAIMFDGAAIYLEYGTAKMPAYPFIRPSVVANQQDYLRRLAITTQGRVRGPVSGLAQ